MDVRKPVRRRRERAMSSKTATERGAISCILYTKSRGQVVECDLFNVPLDEDYGAGNLTGMRLAAEFMQAIKCASPGLPRFDALGVITDACVALGEDGNPRRGAAVGFLRMLESFLMFAATRCDHQGHVARAVERHLEFDRKQAADIKQEKLDFVRRMEIAKAAKARERARATSGA